MNEKQIVVRVRGIIIHDGKLLTVKHGVNSKFVALPGGHLEWGEDVIECLSREIVEELGVVPEVGRLMFVNNFTEEDTVQSIEFFIEVKNGRDFLDLSGKDRTHAHEIAEVIWMDRSDSIELRPKEFDQLFKNGNISLDEVIFFPQEV